MKMERMCSMYNSFEKQKRTKNIFNIKWLTKNIFLYLSQAVFTIHKNIVIWFLKSPWKYPETIIISPENTLRRNVVCR